MRFSKGKHPRITAKSGLIRSEEQRQNRGRKWSMLKCCGGLPDPSPKNAMPETLNSKNFDFVNGSWSSEMQNLQQWLTERKETREKNMGGYATPPTASATPTTCNLVVSELENKQADLKTHENVEEEIQEEGGSCQEKETVLSEIPLTPRPCSSNQEKNNIDDDSVIKTNKNEIQDISLVPTETTNGLNKLGSTLGNVLTRTNANQTVKITIELQNNKDEIKLESGTPNTRDAFMKNYSCDQEVSQSTAASECAGDASPSSIHEDEIIQEDFPVPEEVIIEKTKIPKTIKIITPKMKNPSYATCIPPPVSGRKSVIPEYIMQNKREGRLVVSPEKPLKVYNNTPKRELSLSKTRTSYKSETVITSPPRWRY